MTAARSHLPLLVTGAAGFVGAALVREIVSRGRVVWALDDESAGTFGRLEGLANVVRVRASVEDGLPDAPERFDAVVHLAARVGVATVVRDPEAARRANESAAEALVAWLARADRPPHVFAASTSEVYRDRDRPLAEDDALRDTDDGGRFAYAASKIASERRFDAWAASDPARRGVAHLRFFNVVGPGQDAEQGMVLPRFVEHARAGRPLPVYGDGRSVRTFAHVDDVAVTLADLVALAPRPRGALNVGGNARASVAELAACVLRCVRGETSACERVDPRRTLGPAFAEIDWREPDLTRLAALGVRVPARGLEEIVRDTCARHVRFGRGRVTCESRAS